MKKIAFYYFTGTGNTLHAVNTAKSFFEKKGFEVGIYDAAKSSALSGKDSDMAVFAFPVYGFTAPALFADFCRKIADGNNKPAAVFSVNGGSYSDGKVKDGNSAYSPFFIAKILKKRKFKIQQIGSFSYPTNWTQVMNPQDKDSSEKMISLSDRAVIAFAENIASGKEIRPERGLISLLFSLPVGFSYRIYLRRMLGKIYVADEKCNGCGLCAKSCPSGTILMKNGKPAWKSDCQSCNRCINICPERAVQTSIARLIFHSAGFFALYYFALCFLTDFTADKIDSGNKLIHYSSSIGLKVSVFIICVLFMMTIGDYILRILERLPVLKKLFVLNFTSSFRRYTAPGFRQQKK